MSKYPNSLLLKNILLEKIASSPQQIITFAEFMELALYQENYGYYSSVIAEIGSKGDFFTSSSLGKDFGELLAIQFEEVWQNLNYPNLFYLVEIGSGNGNLANDILNYCQLNSPDLFKALQYIIIEKSCKLRKQQQQLLKNYENKITWSSWNQISDNSLVGCFFSNELIDAFPVHQLVINQGKLQEVYLTNSSAELTETTGEISTPQLQEYFKLVGVDFPSDRYPEGYRTEVNLTALTWLKTVAKKLSRGYLLTIDYGYQADKYYHPQRSQGTLQCHYQHRRHNNPYLNLGYQDLTAHVNFTALERQGELLGLETIGLTQQGMFLMSLGLGDRLIELSSGKYNAVQVFQRRDALHQLIDPMGLGGFWVLIQGKGLKKEEKALKGFTVPSLT